MTTYNTQNPIGSADPRDLYDNAQNLDTLLNDPDKLSHEDRLGVARKTWHGIEEAFQTFLLESGYQPIEQAYGAGIEVTARNQIILADGEYWRLSASTELPYTTTGAGMPEGGAFVSVGDAVLRQDLVQPVATFNSVADLKTATGLSVGRKARTLGYYGPGDGGANDYEIVAAGTGTDDGGSFIDLPGSGVQAKGLFTDGAVRVRQFGAVGDDASDDTTPILSAISYCQASGVRILTFNNGVYSVTEVEVVLTAPLYFLLDEGAVIKGASGYSTPVLTMRGGASRHSFGVRGGEINTSLRGFVSGAQSGTGLELIQTDGFKCLQTTFRAGADWSDNVGDSGITTVECTDGLIDGCTFIGQPDIGVYLSGNSSTASSDDSGDIRIVNNRFIRCNVGVSSKRQVARTIVAGNHFYECYAGVTFFEANAVGPGRQSVVANNIFKFTETRALDIRVSSGFVISANLIEDFGYDRSDIAVDGYGIRVLGATKIQGSGNIITMNEWANHASLRAIDVNEHVFDSTTYTPGNLAFTGNTISGVQAAIREANSDANIYDNNLSNVPTPLSGSGFNVATVTSWTNTTGERRTYVGLIEMSRITASNTFVRSLRFMEGFEAATTPSNFSADRYVAVTDNNGATRYLPVSNTAW